MRQKAIPDRAIVYMLFAIGLVSGVVMALFWDKTYTIFGKERSVVFFACVFCLAILDCTCTIAFLTYIGNFRGNYVTALYIGEGISSLLPSLFALAQGTGDEGDSMCNSTQSFNSTAKYEDITQPRFSITVYFWLLFGVLVVSFGAFLVLDFWPSFQKKKISYKKNKIVKDEKDLKIILNRDVSENLLHNKRKDYEDELFYVEPTTESDINGQERGSKVSMKKRQILDKVILLVLITLVSFFIYGFLPGLSSYSAMPYGSKIMHLCSTLSKYSIFLIKKRSKTPKLF
jgi:riboflavin transporter 2